MFILLSKTLDLLLDPLAWTLLLGIAGLLLRRRRPVLGLAASSAGLGVLLVFSLQPVAQLLQRRAEAGARSTFRPEPAYDVVILLGGVTDAAASRVSGTPELEAAADRVVRTAMVLRTGAAREALVVGGEVFPVGDEPSEAERLRDVLVGLGIEPGRIAVETRSRNTRENAVAAARIVATRGWRRMLLVTSAAHMPRALGCFRAAGLEPDALPVDRRAGDGRGLSWIPRSQHLFMSAEVLHELAGRAVYRLAGWTR